MTDTTEDKTNLHVVEKTTSETTETPPSGDTPEIKKRKGGPGRPKGSTSKIGRSLKQEPQTSETTDQRAPGRPARHANNSSGITSFPSPGNSAMIKQFKRFIEYWFSLTPLMITKCEVRVYRQWPRIDRSLSGNRTQEIDLIGRDGTSAICPFTLDEYETQVLHRYGTGKYKFIMNELGVHGAVAMSFVSVDDPMLPPRINYAELDMGYPENKSYIEGLRQRGVKLPGDPDFKSEAETQGETDDMVVSNGLVELVQKQSDTITQMATRQQAPAPVAPAITDDATKTSLSIVKSATDLYSSIIDKAQDNAARLSVNQTDPLAVLKAVSELVKPSGAPDATTIMLQSMMEQNAALQREVRESAGLQTQTLLEMLKNERAEKEAARLNAPQPKTLIEQMREAKEITDMMSGKRRRSDDDDEEDDGKKKENLVETVVKFAPLVIGGLTTLFTLGANIMHNARLKPGEKPEPPPVTAVTAAGTPGNMMANQPGQPTTIIDPETGQPVDPQLVLFLSQLEGPFLSHFFGRGDGRNGFSLADHIYTSHPSMGPQNYYVMRGAGPEQLVKYLSIYPPIWDRVSMLPKELGEFIDEFMRYEEIKAEMANGGDEEDEGDDNKPHVN